MRNVTNKVVEKIKTHILCSLNFFFRKSCLFEIMWENNVEPGRPQMTIWPTHIACWIQKSKTHTHTHTHTHTQNMRYSYFCRTTSVARRRANVTSFVHCLSF